MAGRALTLTLTLTRGLPGGAAQLVEALLQVAALPGRVVDAEHHGLPAVRLHTAAPTPSLPAT